MKKNEKGFTLIELLAVIVILAIIALITTPIVLDLISNARLDAAKDKTYGVIDAVRLAYTQNQVTDNPAVGDSNNIITVTFGSGAPKVGTTNVSISGEAPTGGTVEINTQSGTVVAKDLLFSGFTCNTTSGKAACTTRSGS